ncbi:MAG: V-type ATP synthase subunit D, partial [Candidatus Thermoplasmatota archaeon]|nr:V-type ATP synthase subunit D [Candidatus Thermoplasmatota archaeon]
MALDIKPTRSELIKLKARIKQTKNGYKLLKMKRDGLFHEFRQLLSQMIEAKRDLTDAYRLAKQRIDLANAIDGGLAVRAAAIANSAQPEVEVERRNIMGVVVPSVSGTNLKSTFEERGVGYIGSSPYIDEASDSFSDLIEKIVTASEMEATLKRLLEEIEATKRRVNALEFKVIPELEEAKVFIQLRLEEMEREVDVLGLLERGPLDPRLLDALRARQVDQVQLRATH